MWYLKEKKKNEKITATGGSGAYQEMQRPIICRKGRIKMADTETYSMLDARNVDDAKQSLLNQTKYGLVHPG